MEQYTDYDGSGWRKDDSTRIYTAWDRNKIVVETRPYTAAENAAADARSANSTREQTRRELRASVEGELIALAASSAAITTTLADPQFDTKAVANLRALAKIVKQTVDDLVALARIVVDAVD